MDTNEDENSVQQYDSIFMRGINISGAEAGTDVSYAYLGMPSLSTDMQYYIDHGMNTIRFPIKLSYIVDSKDAETASAEGQIYLDAVAASVSEMLDAGLYVILDLHSYMRYSPDAYAGSGNDIVSAQDMYNTWSIIADSLHDIAVAHPDTLLLEISNEPNSMPTMQVLENNNAGIAAIRDAGLTNMVVIQGNSWSGLHSWFESGSATDGLSNAEVMIPENIVDPLNNYAIAVHQYVDWNGSGTSPQGQVLENFIEYANVDEFMQWVRENDVKVLMDEFGSGQDANGIDNVNYLLSQVEANPYVEGQGGFIGWAAWVGGHTWVTSNFNYIGPNPDGTDNILMTEIYAQHLDPLDPGITVPPVDDPVDQTPTGDTTDSSNPDNTDQNPDNDPITQPIASSHQIDWNWGARDIINDFDASTDAVDLSAFWKSFNDISISEDGQGNININLLDVDNQLLTLSNVSFTDFGANNILGVAGNYSDAVIDNPVQYYSYTWNYGANNVIENFNPETGVLDLIGFSRGFDGYEIYNNANGNAVVDAGFNKQTITLNGTSAEELSASNFYGVSGSILEALAETLEPINDPIVDEPVAEDPVLDDPVMEDPVLDEPVDEGVSQHYSYDWNWGGRDFIDGFNTETDSIDLSAFWTNYNNIKIYGDGDGNTVIDLLSLNNQTITLNNTLMGDLSANNIEGVSGSYLDAVLNDPMKVYSYSWNYGSDSTIENFDPDVGVIDLTAFNKGFNDVDVNENGDGNAVVNLAFDNQTITLIGVAPSDIDTDNFLGG